MNEMPKTPQSLIAQIQQQDGQSLWEEFLKIYTPVVFGFLRTKGLQDADASDVTQETFRAVARSIQSFNLNPEKGRFRNWLFVIVRNKLIDHSRRSQREPQGSGDSDIHFQLENISQESDQSLWDIEYKRRVFNFCADQIRDEFTEQTWQAFWLTSVEGQSTEEVADKLKMNASNVYVCKSRVITRLREKIKRIEGE